MQRIDFLDNVRKENKICNNKITAANILHYVLCCWVSPFGSFEVRTGYFDDYSEAEDFAKNLIKIYKDFNKYIVMLDQGVVNSSWS